VKETTQESSFLKQLNDAFKENQDQYKVKIEKTEKLLADDSKDKKIQELEDEIKDLMMHLDTKEKLKNSEAEEGSLVIIPGNEKKKKTPKRKPRT